MEGFSKEELVQLKNTNGSIFITGSYLCTKGATKKLYGFLRRYDAQKPFSFLVSDGETTKYLTLIFS